MDLREPHRLTSAGRIAERMGCDLLLVQRHAERGNHAPAMIIDGLAYYREDQADFIARAIAGEPTYRPSYTSRKP